MDRFNNGKRPTKVSVSQIVIRHLSVFALLQVAMIPALHRAYISLSIENVELLPRIGGYLSAFDLVRGTFQNF